MDYMDFVQTYHVLIWNFLSPSVAGKMQRTKYISFIDLTKVFDLVSRDSLLKILTKITCPPKLKDLIKSFHNNVWGTVQNNGNLS